MGKNSGTNKRQLLERLLNPDRTLFKERKVTSFVRTEDISRVFLRHLHMPVNSKRTFAGEVNQPAKFKDYVLEYIVMPT